MEIRSDLRYKYMALILVLSAIAFVMGCGATKKGTTPAEVESSAELKARLQSLQDEVWLKGNLDVLNETLAADFVLHKLGEVDALDLDTYKEGIEGTRSMFPDCRVIIERVIREDDMMVTQWRFTGTYVGPKAIRWMFWHAGSGESQSVVIPMLVGKKYTVMGCTVARMVDGKIVEEWDYSDDMVGPLLQSGIAFMVEPIE
jgi:predicted ester cyclase